MAQQCPQCHASNRFDASFCANCGAPLSPNTAFSRTLNSGKILQNRYRIVSLLGQGGFGAVYRAYDVALNRPCAVKENLEAGQNSQQQFQQEASVLANLSHNNLPRVTDHFFIPGQGQYLVMDFIDGCDLDSGLSQGKTMPVAEAVEAIIQIAEALTYLHTRPSPIIHRDIKPANIRLTSEGKAFLVDFGLVKLYATHKMTSAAARGVTPGFSPPEQYGQGGTDARSDIYALGATLYALVTGTVPQESVVRTAHDALPPASQLNPSVPLAVNQVISRAMALDPAQRYPSARAFAAALAGSLTAPLKDGTVVIPQDQSAAAASAPADPSSFPVSRPLLSGLAIGALLMGLVLVVLVVTLGFILLPRLLETPTSLPAVLVVTATPGFADQPASTAPGATLNPTSMPPQQLPSDPAAAEPTEASPPTVLPTGTPEPAIDLPPVLDPNQGWVVFRSSRSGYVEIGLMRAGGGGFRLLTEHETLCDEPDFSPDGQRIAFEQKLAQDYSSWEIFVIGVDGEGEYSLGKGRLPAWSPDGQWLAFETQDENGNEQIFRMAMNGGSRKQLTWDDHPNRGPSWSPDGQKLVMMAKIGEYWQLVVLDLNSMEQKQVTSGSLDKRFPEWSPDGQWIAYNTLKGGNPDQIWIIKPDGSNPTALTRSGQNGRPTWSPDSRYLLFNALVNDTWSIVRIASDGSDYQVVAPGEQPDWTP